MPAIQRWAFLVQSAQCCAPVDMVPKVHGQLWQVPWHLLPRSSAHAEPVANANSGTVARANKCPHSNTDDETFCGHAQMLDQGLWLSTICRRQALVHFAKCRGEFWLVRKICRQLRQLSWHLLRWSSADAERSWCNYPQTGLGEKVDEECRFCWSHANVELTPQRGKLDL